VKPESTLINYVQCASVKVGGGGVWEVQHIIIDDSMEFLGTMKINNVLYNFCGGRYMYLKSYDVFQYKILSGQRKHSRHPQKIK
jgi:hypothetical protein